MPPWFVLSLYAYLALALLSFAALMLLSAPYGRHGRKGWGPGLPTRLAWVLWESPQVLVFLAVYLHGPRWSEPAPLVLMGLWMLHYVHRTFVFPLRMRADPARRTPWLILALGIGHNSLCSVLNAAWLTEVGPGYPADWLCGPAFVGGAALFLAGFAINRHSDAILRGLRRPGEGGYGLPTGGLYRWVSCPNYLGEILTWCGFALAAASPAGLAFAVYTAANLVPRALDHHLWYRRCFSAYPAERCAIFPFVL
jgi:protein-S-isoprenylcysteine O-methyltransferase Ste14